MVDFGIKQQMPSREQPLQTRPRVVVVTNIPSPYRIPFFVQLSTHVDLYVVFDARTESNRHWDVPEILPFQSRFASGFTFAYARKRNDGVASERRELHLRYGVLAELIRLKPDVVVSQELGFRSLLALAYCTVKVVPLILWQEGTAHTEGWVGTPKRIIRRLLCRRASRVWGNGVESAALVHEYAPETPTDDGMTGVDTEWFAERVRAIHAGRDGMRVERAVRRVCFLFVGQLANRKGVRPMLQAFTSAVGIGTDFTVLLAGEGPLRPEIVAWQQEHPSCDLRLMGHLSPEELVKLYAIADVFLLPTLDDNWALATLEGAVAGLPQVFSKYNGATAELTAQGATGVTVDPLQPEQFAAALANFIATPPPRLSTNTVAALVTFYSPKEFALRALRSIGNALGED